MRLIRAEVLRLVSRRLFRLFAGLAVLGILVAAVLTSLQSSKDAAAGVAEARRQAASCERARVQAEREGVEAGIVCPSVEQLASEFDDRFRYADTMPDATRGVAAGLLVVAVLVGASFVGAEWGTGGMSTWLTWEPRRGRVLATKAVAGTVTVALATAAALALLDVVYLPVGALRGTLEGVNGELWITLGGVWLRAAGLAAFGVALGIGLATLLRSTAGAVVIGIGYAGFVDPLLSNAWNARFRGWLLTYNVARLLGFPVPPPGGGGFDGAGEAVRVMAVNRPLILLSVYAAALMLAAYAAFRASDVT